jgi:hypothetical protein
MEKQLQEMSFKSDLIGLSEHIETIAIITAENPKGKALSKEENNEKCEQFESILKAGKFVYRKVIGQYNSKEHSYVISNIALSEIKNLAAQFEQESFIFGSVDKLKKLDKTNRSCLMNFDYWSIKDISKKIEASSYIKEDTIDRVVYTDKALDFFTRRKNFKFNLPFSIFESMSSEYSSFNINEEIMQKIKTDLNNNMSGRHLWENRARNYKKGN